MLARKRSKEEEKKRKKEKEKKTMKMKYSLNRQTGWDLLAQGIYRKNIYKIHT